MTILLPEPETKWANRGDKRTENELPLLPPAVRILGYPFLSCVKGETYVILCGVNLRKSGAEILRKHGNVSRRNWWERTLRNTLHP